MMHVNIIPVMLFVIEYDDKKINLRETRTLKNPRKGQRKVLISLNTKAIYYAVQFSVITNEKRTSIMYKSSRQACQCIRKQEINRNIKCSMFTRKKVCFMEIKWRKPEKVRSNDDDRGIHDVSIK